VTWPCGSIALLEFLDVPAEHRHARQLCSGRIVDVRHETRDGWH
jgi:hypothetical protein